MAGAHWRTPAGDAEAADAGLRRGRLARHPHLTDAAVVVLLELVLLPQVVHLHIRWWALLLDQLLVLPTAVRRRAPLGVFAFVAAVALVQWFSDERLSADVALLVALYTVAAYQSRRRAVAAAGVLEVGVVMASLRFSPAQGGFIPSTVFLSGLVAAALFVGITLQTRRAYLASLVDRAARAERERDHQGRLAATAERTRIAREMHDIVAHSLSVMITLADGATLANPRDPVAATGAMQQVSATGRQALAEMRRLLGVLREDDGGVELAPQPGLGQLDGLLGQMRAAGLPVHLVVSGAPHPLSVTAGATVYRLVQEALTNVLKHARDATRVLVSLRWSADHLELVVDDDGRLPVSGGRGGRSDEPPGHGLVGMRERLSVHDGHVTAGRRPEGGWRVHARLPLDRAPAPSGAAPDAAPGEVAAAGGAVHPAASAVGLPQ